MEGGQGSHSCPERSAAGGAVPAAEWQQRSPRAGRAGNNSYAAAAAGTSASAGAAAGPSTSADGATGTKGLLSLSHVPVVNNSSLVHGRAGMGLAVYVKRSMWPRVTVRHVSSDGCQLWVQVCVGGKVLVVGNIYVPQGSNVHSHADVFDQVADCVQRCTAEGALVCVVGDFNAHVGQLEDRHFQFDGTAAHAHVLSRSFESRQHNPYGSRLVDMCQASGVVLLTGRHSSDVPVLPSYVARDASTRPDHILVSPGLLPWVQHHAVVADLHGSDHLPLLVQFAIPQLAPVQCPVPPHDTGHLSPRLIWDQSKVPAYRQAFTDVRVLGLLDDAKGCLPQNCDAAVDKLHEAMRLAAQIAGMKVYNAPSGIARCARRHRRFQPWFDAECQQVYATLRSSDCSPQAVRMARALFQRKKRAYARQQMQLYLDACARSPANFWRMLARRTRGPNAGPNVEAFHSHFGSVFAGHGPMYSPAYGDPPADEVLDAVFSAESLEVALSKVPAAAAPGLPGVPLPAFQVGAVQDCVLAVMKAMYCQAYEPPSCQYAVLTPVHKRGDMSIPANYRPIAISSVLHKLYARCLLRHLDEHYCPHIHKVFPRQAGFTKGRSTLHSLFVLQHFCAQAGALWCLSLCPFVGCFAGV
eukprot:jgi/Chrzof1/14362/Cz09g00020.t1